MNTLWIALLLTTAMPSFEVQTLDGQTLVAPLAELSADRVAVDAPGGRKVFETERLISLAPQGSPKSNGKKAADGIVIRLIDGSTIQAKQYLAKGAGAKITLLDGSLLETPTKNVQAVRLQPETDSVRAEWARWMEKETESDLLVVRKDQAIDYHKGVLHDATEDTVHFDLDGEVLPVKRSKVYGFIYRHGSSEKLAPTVCRLTDANGSQWAVHTISLTDKIAWTTPAGVNVAMLPSQVQQIDFSGGKIVYLSDLKPDSHQWTPYFDAGKVPAAASQFYAPRFDRGFEPGPMVLGGTTYRKGVAIYSRTEMLYRLPDRFSRFRAIAGIANVARPNGKVRLVLRGDDQELLNVRLTGKDAPRPIDVDLAGVRRLTILVDYDGTFSPGDYVFLCNARLSK
jgi:hypothetical protein